MKLGISTRGLNQGSYAISTIVLHLTRKLIELAGTKHEVFVYCNDPSYEKLFPTPAVKRSVRLKNRFLWDHIWLPQALKKDHIDIALFMKGTMPVFLPCKGAVIFHDLGYFDNQLRPYPFFDTVYMKIMMSRAAKKSSAIFTDSNYTRSEAIRLFNLDSHKANTCYQDCSPIYYPVTDQKQKAEIRRRHQLPSRFVFCPVSLSTRKNLARILKAFELVKNKVPQDIVVTGGQASIANDIFNRISRESSARVHLLGHVENEDMPMLYSLADYTIYPSLLEGFGMPVLEAFRCGCPILTSNITSIPEVAGDAAYLINPYETSQIATGMVKLATDSTLRQTLIQKGFEQAKKFSWERTARIVLDSLESCYDQL